MCKKKVKNMHLNLVFRDNIQKEIREGQRRDESEAGQTDF